MPVHAITGATGRLGRLAVQELLARGVPAPDVVALVRTPGKAADLAERGVQVRHADYSRPQTLKAALTGVDRLLLVSSSEPGQRVAHHTNVIEAAKAAGASRIVYTSMLKADDTTNPLAGEHLGTEAALRAAGVPVTVLRNGWYTENYTDQLPQYLERGWIVGAAGSGRISAATRQDYAAAAAVALLQDDPGNRTYELGGPAFDLPELAHAIRDATATPVTYRDLSAQEYTSWLQEAGLDLATADFVASLDASIAHGDLETDSQDLAQLLGRPATPLADVLRPRTSSAASTRPGPPAAVPARPLQDLRTDVPAGAVLPLRPGPRPATQTVRGQSQLDGNGSPDLAGRLVEAIKGLDDVRLGPSGIAGPSADAGHLSPEIANGPPEAFVVGTEFGHVHRDGTGSLHIVLPTDRAAEAVESGWAEWHPTVQAGVRPPNLVLVYGARNDDEFAVVWGLVQDSYSFARGAAAA